MSDGEDAPFKCYPKELYGIGIARREHVLGINAIKVQRTWYHVINSKNMFFGWLTHNVRNEIRLEKHPHLRLNLLHFNLLWSHQRSHEHLNHQPNSPRETSAFVLNSINFLNYYYLKEPIKVSQGIE